MPENYLVPVMRILSKQSILDVYTHRERDALDKGREGLYACTKALLAPAIVSPRPLQGYSAALREKEREMLSRPSSNVHNVIVVVVVVVWRMPSRQVQGEPVFRRDYTRHQLKFVVLLLFIIIFVMFVGAKCIDSAEYVAAAILPRV